MLDPKIACILSSVFQEASEEAGTTRSPMSHPLSPDPFSLSSPLLPSPFHHLSIVFSTAFSFTVSLLCLYPFLTTFPLKFTPQWDCATPLLSKTKTPSPPSIKYLTLNIAYLCVHTYTYTSEKHCMHHINCTWSNILPGMNLVNCIEQL